VSQELPLQSIELDLEDEKNPRINVTVQEDNKLLKHILFRPSRLVLISSIRDLAIFLVVSLDVMLLMMFIAQLGR